MMLGKQQLVLPVKAGRLRLELFADQILLEQFLLEPQWQGHAERGEPARREGEIGLKQPLELDERLLVEHDVINLVELHAAFVEAIANGILRIARILLLAGKTFLLRRGNDMPV